MRMGLVSELRRRNVLRMLVLYVVTAWLIMQVAEVLIDLANLPDWVGTTTLWLLAIGFPIALIFSWFYEVTPEGISLEKNVARGESITHVTGRRLDFLVISLLCAAVILFAYDKWWIGPPLEQSIAVLPFENTSPDKDSADFLAIGIQDDLVTRLSKIADLKVISRTSTERYRDTKKTARNIGRELGVSKVLQGAVQRAGDQIRVNVQLIDAVMDEHLWAATYDRDLTAENVFAIQSEIVEAIIQELKSTLTPEETLQLATMPTRNFDAYTAYLNGRNLADIESVESLDAAIVHFKMAIELDGNFALAYVGLADTYLTLAANFLGGLSTDESNALAEPPLIQALALDSSLGEAHATLGLLRQQQGNLQAAEQAYQEAISLRPNYPRVFRLYGRLRWRQGRSEEAMELLQTALSLDPFSVPINFDVGRLYDESGHFEEALERYLQVVEIEPDHAFAYVYIAAIHYLVFGRADESLIWYQKAAENDALSPSLQAAQALAYLELGDAVSAKEWVDRGVELGPRTFWPVWSSLLYNSYTGDDAAAQADARILLEVYPLNSGGLRLLRNADIAAGRYEVARSRYARAFRELTEPEVPEVTTDNYRAAVDLALVLMRLDEQERANDLLEGSLKVIAKLPRLGVNGYYITDVQIFALQQRRQRALDALRQAIEDGWRFLAWYHLEQDPNMDAIRGEPEFDKLYQVVKADLAKQTKRVQDLKASGELRSVPLLDQ
jgi:TolB-like protein/Flp pilus assembly protein TadD